MRFKSILFFLAVNVVVLAQTDNEIVNQFIERYIENTADEVDIQQFASDLLLQYENPLDLNNADATELFEARFITNFQALDIITHREKFGDFINIYELQVLETISLEDIQNILPFITLKSTNISLKNFKQIGKDGSHQILSLVEINTPKVRGSLISDTLSDRTSSHYTGSPLYNNLRYRFDYKRNISFGINMEKDAGESFLGDNNPSGYDYYSYYFAARDIGKLKALHLGDFQANFGQGLTLSTGLAFGKSSIITNSKRNFNGFGAYRSLRENAYLRGGAIALELSKATLGVFASYKNVDGNALEIDTSDQEAPIVAMSLQEDGGLHRTPSELADKDAISDFQTGFYFDYKLPFGRIGTVNYLRKLGAVLEPSYQPYNKFNFRGDEYYKNGLYYDFVYRNVNLYGEVSHSSFEHSIGQVHGALMSINKALDASLVYRNYSKSFITLQSSSFGESSNPANEEGLYLGFEARLNKEIKLLGYYDLFTSDWLRSAASAPSSGSDFWGELQYKPSRSFKAYYRFRTETKQANSEGGELKQLSQVTTQRHRIHIAYTISKGIELRNRVEWSIYDEGGYKSKGSLIYQDIIFKPFGSNLQLSGRAAYSVIEQFNNRIYSFEQVPLYDYPLFTHSFSGMRYYLLARYKVKRGLDFWFRYAISQHDEPLNSLEPNYSIGSGLNKINGNIKRTFTLQIKYQIK